MPANKLLIFLVFCAAGFTYSCKKTAEEAVDCFAESVLTSLHGTNDDANKKIIHFNASYDGDKTISSIAWEFGDGTTATTTSQTTDHTYEAAGNYTAKAKVTFKEQGGSCTVEPTKLVSIPL